MAKRKLKITEAALIRKEVSACMRLRKAVGKVQQIKAMLADIEDASNAVDRASADRKRFQETK